MILEMMECVNYIFSPISAICTQGAPNKRFKLIRRYAAPNLSGR